MMNVTSNHLLLAPILFTASVYLTILIRRKPNELFRVDPNRTGRKTLEEMMKAARYETSPLSNSKLFLEWCRSSFLAKMRSNKEYQEKVGIRNIRKANWQLLQEIDDREKKAKDEWKLSPSYNRFQLVSEKLTGIYKAVESMEQSILSGADTEKIKRIQTTLLPSKKSELRDLKEEYDSLCTLPLYREMVSSIDVAAQLRKKLGLVDAKAALLNTQKEIGHRKRDGGFGFEDVASDIIQRDLVSQLASKYGITDLTTIVIARNITLGMGSHQGSPGEIDIMVCAKVGLFEEALEDRSGSSKRKLLTASKLKNISKTTQFAVQVLGVVEVKKNADDIASAFQRYHVALNWLCGSESDYNPANFITSVHPTGHFRTSFPHKHSETETLVFTKQSFSLLKARDLTRYAEHLATRTSDIMSNMMSKCYIDHLYFVTKQMPLDNIPSKLFNVMAHMIATGLEFDDDLLDDEPLENLRIKLLEDSLSMLCTYDLLKLYDITGFCNQLFIVT